MRILIHSNAPFATTGYGTQTAIWAPRFASLGHDVAVSAFWGLHATRLEWNGIPVYPAGLTHHGNDVLAGHAADFGADLVLTLTDIWVLDPQMLSKMHAAHWVPVDCAPLGAYDSGSLTASGVQPIAMSEFGRDQLANAGFAPLYAPHGIDTAVFAPGDKAAARARIGIPEDAFVIGLDAANKDPVRKAFPEQFAAFALFRQRHPEALLLAHTTQQGLGDGTDLCALAGKLGIADAIRWSDPYKYATGGFSAADMALWYNCLDLYTGAAYAEGFGLPIVQAQACGVPVVVTDASAMTELCGAGWAVEGEPWWNPGHLAWWCKPSIQAIADAYSRARDGEAAALAGQARQFALAYDADRVLADHWEPVLKELEARLA